MICLVNKNGNVAINDFLFETQEDKKGKNLQEEVEKIQFLTIFLARTFKMHSKSQKQNSWNFQSRRQHSLEFPSLAVSFLYPLWSFQCVFSLFMTCHCPQQLFWPQLVRKNFLTEINRFHYRWKRHCIFPQPQKTLLRRIPVFQAFISFVFSLRCDPHQHTRRLLLMRTSFASYQLLVEIYYRLPSNDAIGRAGWMEKGKKRWIAC